MVGDLRDAKETRLQNLDRPVRIAVFIEQEISGGGGFQQALNMLLLLKQLPKTLCELIVVTTIEKNIQVVSQYGIQALLLPLPFRRKLNLWLRSNIQNRTFLNFIQKLIGLNYLDRFLLSQHVDLIYFTSPTIIARLTEIYNYAYTVWDLCHRDELEFPEVRQGREFEQRERLHRLTLTKATAILVDSELGRENIVHRYGVDTQRIFVMPFSASAAMRQPENDAMANRIDIKAKYEINGEYIFYPAQFWPHKNHVYLLNGLVELEQRYGLRLTAVFSGTDMGNMNYVKAVAADQGLSDRVKFIGFAPTEELRYLYKQSMALVMPTYFGPTNLPPLEAFTLDVPVLYSDLPGLREQVGDAALLMDLSDPGSMAEHLYRLATQPKLRTMLIDKGKVRLQSFSDKERIRIIETIIKNYKNKRRCWAENYN